MSVTHGVARLTVLHAARELRAQRHVLLLLGVLVLYASDRRAPDGALTVGIAVFLALWVAPRWDPAAALLARLPRGAAAVYLGKLAFLAVAVFGIHAVHGAFVVLKRVSAGVSVDAGFLVGGVQDAWLPVLTASFLAPWCLAATAWCRPRWLVGCLAVVTLYVGTIPIMWARGGERALRFDGLVLDARAASAGLDALGLAVDDLSKAGLGMLVSVAVGWLCLGRHGSRWRGARAWGLAAGSLLLTSFGVAGATLWADCAAQARRHKRAPFTHGYISPDGDVACLARGTMDANARVDLRSGAVEALEPGIWRGRLSHTMGREPPGQGPPLRRGVPSVAHVRYRHGVTDGWLVLDIATGGIVGRVSPPASGGAGVDRIRAGARAAGGFTLPDGRRAWILRGQLEVETPTGFERVRGWPGLRIAAVRGFLVTFSDGSCFDLVRMKRYQPRLRGEGPWGLPQGWVVKSIVRRSVGTKNRAWSSTAEFIRDRSRWELYDPEAQTSSPAALDGEDAIVAVRADGRVLVRREPVRARAIELALVDPQSGSRQRIALPDKVGVVYASTWPWSGRLVLRTDLMAKGGRIFITTLPAESAALTPLRAVYPCYSAPDADGWVITARFSVERVNVDTGAREVLCEGAR